GALVNETLAVVFTILLALLLGAASFAPVPTALVALSPARAITGPFLATAFSLSPAEFDVLMGDPRLFESRVPLALWETLLSLAVGAVAASCCIVGRAHAFTPGFNNFGAVVIPGDRRRAAILRFRPVLVRR